MAYLQELLTLKSDDIMGGAKTYEAIVKGDNVPRPGIPESFNVLVHELRAWVLTLNLKSKEQKPEVSDTTGIS